MTYLVIKSLLKNKILEKNAVIPYSVMDGDDSTYNVGHIDLQNFLPEEDVYKPKKKATPTKSKNLENFMEEK